ncbi:MAG: ComEC/Rec2 family competence protein [Leucobacter sp.]
MSGAVAGVRAPPGMWRILAPALVAWLVAAVCIGIPGFAAWVFGVAAFVGSVAILGSLAAHRLGGRMRTWGTVVIALLRYGAIGSALLVLLATRISGEEAARAPPALIDASEEFSLVEAHAVLTGFPEVSDTPFGSRDWVRAELQLESGGVPVLLWLNAPPEPRWAPGTGVWVSGTLEQFEAASSAAYGVTVREIRDPSTHEADTCERDEYELTLCKRGLKQPGLSFVSELRSEAGKLAAELRLRLREAAVSVDGAELVPGFAVGDTQLVPAQLDAQMKESSLTHLTAVSGANCALIIGAVVALASRLGAKRRVRILCAGIALGGFVVVVGPDASVQRAAVMATVMLASDFGGKRSVALPALGAAMCVLLITDPWQAREPGFTLSVAATGGILLCVPVLDRAIRRFSKLPRLLTLPVSVALAAQLSCAPLLLLLDDGIPAVGVLANVVAAPAAPVGTGVGLVAMLLLPVSASLGVAAVTVASWATQWVAATAEVTAALPLARWYWPGGGVGALTLAACEAALLIAWGLATGRLQLPRLALLNATPEPFERDPWHPGMRLPRPVRIATVLLVCGSLGTMTAISAVTPATNWAVTPRDWSVVACDVGQGDALLLRDPRVPEDVMLVDTGEDTELLQSCLDRFGVTRIRLLVLSHDDRDHVGALDVVLPLVEEALVAPPTAEQQHEGRPVVDDLDRAGVRWSIGAAGHTGQVSNGGGGGGPASGMRWQVLAPESNRTPRDSNSASLVMRVDAGEITVLLLGDTGADEHAEILQSESVDTGSARSAGPQISENLAADVVKIAHHGSNDQDPRILAASGATLGLISVGMDNGYGHPHPAVLRDLAERGIQPLRTDLHGAIAVRTTDEGPRAWVEVGGAH